MWYVGRVGAHSHRSRTREGRAILRIGGGRHTSRLRRVDTLAVLLQTIYLSQLQSRHQQFRRVNLGLDYCWSGSFNGQIRCHAL